MKGGISVIENKVKSRLEKMTQKVRSPKAFIQMTLYPKYLEHQMLRWASENYGQWKPLNPDYERMKKKKFASFPGAGNKMMIARGRLYKAVLGQNNFHAKIITDSSLSVGVNFTGKGEPMEYAKFANELRPFMKFHTGRDYRFITEIKYEFIKYMGAR